MRYERCGRISSSQSISLRILEVTVIFRDANKDSSLKAKAKANSKAKAIIIVQGQEHR